MVGMMTGMTMFMMAWYNGGKKEEPAPVILPIRVAWIISGAVRTLYLCSFNLRRNVLDAPGNAEYHVFASVAHEGTEMELQGLVGLKYFPETRAILADSEIACRRQEHMGEANITTSMIWRRSTSARWTNPRVSWAVQSCAKRNLWYQYSKVGMGFKLAARHAAMTGQKYDVAVRARTDVLFTARLDVATMHLGYLARDATLKAAGEYVATESNGFCGGLTESGVTELCWTMQLADGLMIGSAQLMLDLWCAPARVAPSHATRPVWLDGPAQRHQNTSPGTTHCRRNEQRPSPNPISRDGRGRKNMTSMDESYACCEEILRWNLVFRVGVRQAPDDEQEPTLPRFSAFAKDETPSLDAKDTGWYQGDKMRPRSGCPVPTKEKKMPKHELCVLPARKTNHDPWQRLGTSHTRTAKATLAMGGPKGNQVLAPYRAPLWRFKPGLGFGIKPDLEEKQKVSMLNGVKVAKVTKTDHVSQSFQKLGKCSRQTMATCAAQLSIDAINVPDKDSAKESASAAKKRNSSASCPVMRKPCRKCHFWVHDEDGRACLPPDAALPTVLSTKTRSHVRGGINRNAGAKDVLG
tara:strand:- start:254 stop:1993 length:1740 start_codon:yes stop_codon:yes gene_type:complete